MEKIDFKELLYLEKSIDVFANKDNLSESQIAIIDEVRDFGIDEIYFSTNEERSYPAVFLKRVTSFDIKTLKEIANTQQKLWNYHKVLFLYVYNDTEIRIYNCSEKPIIIAKNTDVENELGKIQITKAEYNDKSSLESIIDVFSAIAIDTGVIWTSDIAYELRKKVDLKRKVDKYLVESLINTTNQLVKLDLTKEVIHKIILRSLFLLYLEDRGATDSNFYSTIKPQATTYFDVLDDVDSTYQLYATLEKHFNGNVFAVENEEQKQVKKEHLQIIKRCFTIGYEKDNSQSVLFEDWRLFNFKIIQIELLSEIYERFLEETNPKEKKSTGAFYTPPSLVELILNEKLPIDHKNTHYDIKILDPACGSGIFLVESYRRIVKRYENKIGRKVTDFEKLKDLLVNHIFGIELNPQAIVVSAFSLYLALLDNLDPKTLWQSKKLPYLINDPENISPNKQGYNLYHRDSIRKNEDIEKHTFDLVVGNPPFGTEDKSKGVILLDSIREYCNEHNFAKEMVLPFLHKAINFAPNGEIALIFNTKILTNTGSTYQNFRKWLFNDCYVEKIYNFSILRKAPKDFGGQLFGSALGPICIAFYGKENLPKKTDRIVYYAPKTYVKSNVLDGVVIDSTDVKYLPREECQNPCTKIWKIAMWGGEQDFNLIKKIEKNFISIEKYLKDNSDDWVYGSGLHSPSAMQKSKNQFFKPTKKVIDLKRVDRYYTSETAATMIDKIFRPTKESLYKSPYLLVKEGQKEKDFCATIIKFDSYHTGYSLTTKDIWKLNCLCAIINSSFAKYYLALTTSSWGIERERSQANETLLLPSILTTDKEKLQKLSTLVENLICKKKEFFNDIKSLNFEINNYILESILQLTEKDCININDVITCSIDLFDNKDRSKALLPVLDASPYTKMLCSEINDFIANQDLFANGIVYTVNRNTPLVLIKLSFSNKKTEIQKSTTSIDKELKQIDKKLWQEKGGNIYFRKKLNYYDGNDIYIIRPNQRRFWTQSMAMEDASELIIEILNKD